MLLLSHQQIERKLHRLAYEILERNYGEPHLVLAGINTRGRQLAEMLYRFMEGRTDAQLHLTGVKLDPAAPLSHEITFGMPLEEVAGKAVILVDDVANTGRTLFYACRPLMGILLSKLEIAVLVDRTHKAFAVQPNYIGLSLATTVQDNIDVRLPAEADMTVTLE